jgi:hypothetical protein
VASRPRIFKRHQGHGDENPGTKRGLPSETGALYGRSVVEFISRICFGQPL